MYNIADLNAMSDDELIKVAETMGMKKVDLTNKDEVIYGILDQQAINHATSATERSQRQSRDRESKQNNNAADNASAPDAPRKRGRKPKSATVQQVDDSGQDIAQPLVTEQIPQPVDETAAPAVAMPRKRGRKSNAQKAAEAAEAARLAAEQAAGEAAQQTADAQQAVSDGLNDREILPMVEDSFVSDRPVEAQPKMVFTPRRNLSQQGAAVDNDAAGQLQPVAPKVFTPRQSGNGEQNNDAASSLVSFFPAVSGRSFMPRQQRERINNNNKEQSQPQNVKMAPVVIAEPGQKIPNQPQGKGKKNKKQPYAAGQGHPV